jgi:hypothetical protein
VWETYTKISFVSIDIAGWQRKERTLGRVWYYLVLPKWKVNMLGGVTEKVKILKHRESHKSDLALCLWKAMIERPPPRPLTDGFGTEVLIWVLSDRSPISSMATTATFEMTTLKITT